MSTLIIYASTYGYGKDCAEQLKSEIKGDVCLKNITEGKIPPLDEFENVVIGASIYAGQMDKQLKKYVELNTEELAKKNLALYICCGSFDEYEQYITAHFPNSLIQNAKIKTCFGGELRPEKLNFLYKFIIKLILKSGEKNGKPPMKKLPENITAVAEVINSI